MLLLKMATASGVMKLFKLPNYLVLKNNLSTFRTCTARSILNNNYNQTKEISHNDTITEQSQHKPHFGGYRHFSASTQQLTHTSDKSNMDEFRAKEEIRDAQLLKESEDNFNSKQNEAEKEQKDAKMNAIQTQILDAALEHVPTMGWSRETIIKGAEDSGYPGVVHGMFPDGAIALVAHFYSKCNFELVEHLKTETNNGLKEIEDPLDFLIKSVRKRLEMTLQHKSNWPQALAIMTLPQNVPTSLAQLLTLVDDICYYSGDRSVDFNWYTRRVGLATIYKMVEMFMIQDKSPNHEKTWEFLKNRMEEAAQLQLMLSQTEGMTKHFQRSFNSAFDTARNILGLGYNRR